MHIQFIRKITAGFLLAGLFLAPVIGFGETNGRPEESLVKKLLADELLNLEDLGMENPGLLATNPFYFLKTWRRSTLRTLSFNALKRAELELDILKERAGEINLLSEIKKENGDGLDVALNSYEESVNQLQSSIKNIKEDSKSANLDKFLNTLLDRTLKNLRLFDQLKNKTDLNTKGKLDSLQDKLAATTAGALDRWDAPGRLEARMTESLKSQKGGAFKEFLAAQEISRLEESLSSDSDSKGILLILKENLLLKNQIKIFSGNLNSTLPALMELLPGDAPDRIKILDEAREVISDSDLRNDFGSIRQLLLDLSSKSRALSKPEAESLINSVKELTLSLKQQLASAGFRSPIINSLLSRAEFNLKQAEESFKAAQYSSAFGQASIAAAAAKTGLNQLTQRDNLLREIQNWKERYDGLAKTAQEPEILALLARAEKALAKTADQAKKDPNSDKTIQILKEAKLLVLEAEGQLADWLARVEEAAKNKRSSQPLIEKVLQKN